MKNRSSYHPSQDVHGASDDDSQDDNPFEWDEVCKNISDGLLLDEYEEEFTAKL